jgi:hypothetical protein
MSHKKIKITVEGALGTDKSALAILINNALSEVGVGMLTPLDARITINGMTLDPMDVNPNALARLRQVEVLIVLKNEVVTETAEDIAATKCAKVVDPNS